jgi:hypothetical protein
MKDHSVAVVIVTLLLLPLQHAGAAEPNPNLCSAQQPFECLDGVSSSVTALDTLRVSAPSLRERKDDDPRRSAGIPARVAASEGVAGLLAGEAGGWGIWAGLGRADFAGSVVVAPYSAKLDTLRFGVDRLLRGRYVLGAAVVTDRLKTTTRFNGGGQDADSTTLIPYFTMMVTDSISVDLNAGAGRSKTTQRRIDPASVPGTPNILSASFDGERRFWSATVNGLRDVGDWTLGARGGYLYSRERQDAYTETGGPSARTVRTRNLKLGQAFAGADAAYRFTHQVEVYGSGIFRRDTSRNDGSDAGGLPSAVGSTQPGDRTEFEWALGMRFFATRGATLAAEYVKTTGRDRFEHEAYNLLARFDF